MAAADKPSWAMGGITNDLVEQYIYDLLPPRDEVLAEMEAEAAARDVPIVGPAVGRLFYLLARIAGVKTVFEMGSAIGYSTVWWARGVGDGGRVTYTDGDPKNVQKARGYLQRAGVADRVTFRTGDALEILSEQKPGSLDVIFNDVDKVDYPRVFRLAVPRLRSGGLFVTDNVLWSGKVTRQNPPDPETKAILEFNRLLYGSKDLFPSILPLRDGVAIALKS
ncbi:MAG: O-methyltransferase [Acidobacteria bacterium]|nr:O-methyltransferase [Acidobacteriota bacterium]